MKKALILVAILVAMGLTLWVISDEASPPSDPDLRLPPGPQPTRVHGAVLDGDGAPAGGAVVTGRLLGPGVVHRTESLPTKADGAYELALSPARGPWEIAASTPDGRTWRAPEPVVAAPGRSIRLDLRGPTIAPPVREASPNLAGEVVDRYGRALSGITLVIYTSDLAPIARTVSGADGSFATFVDAEAPLRVGAEGADEEPNHVFVLPCLDLSILLPGEKEAEGRIRVGVRLTEYTEGGDGEILFVNSRGERTYQHRIPGESGVYPINYLPYDMYDLFVTVGDLAGRVEGFDFHPGSDGVTVEVGPASILRGRTDRPARLRLRAVSPTYAPLSLEWRQNDAARGRARNVIGQSADPAGEFEFDALPPGRYELIAYGAGVVTKSIAFELAAGEERDLGALGLEEAKTDVRVRVFDRKDDPDHLEFGYRVTLYALNGPCFRDQVLPGHAPETLFAGVSPGKYYLRTERILGGPGHTQSVGTDRPVRVPAEGEKTVTVDQTWRLE